MPIQAGMVRGSSRKLDVSVPLAGLSVEMEGNRHDLPEGLLSVGLGFDISRSTGLLRRSGGHRKLLVDKSALEWPSFFEPAVTISPLGVTDVVTGTPGDPQQSSPTSPITGVIRSNFHGKITHYVPIESGRRITTQPSLIEWEFLRLEVEPGGVSSDKNHRITMTQAGRDRYAQWPEAFGGRNTRVLINNELHQTPKAVSTFNGNPVDPASPPYIRFLNAAEFMQPSGDFAGNPYRDQDWFVEAGPLWSVFVPEHAWDGVTTPTAEALDHFTLNFQQVKQYDKRGAWVTNGRHFWLLQEQKYTHFLDLGNDAYNGIEWRGSQINPGVFMFTSTSHPPVVIRLTDEPILSWDNNNNPFHGDPSDSQLTAEGVSEVHVIRALAGVLPPRGHEGSDVQPNRFLPSNYDDPEYTQITYEERLASADKVVGGERITEGVCRAAIRLWDEATGAVSEFVHLQPHDVDDRGKPAQLNTLVDIPDSDTRIGIISASEASPDSAGEFSAPYKDTRATHVEFWRSSPGGTILYREYRKPLATHRYGHIRNRTGPAFDTSYWDIDYSTMVALEELNAIPTAAQKLRVLSFTGTHIALNRNSDSLIRFSGAGGVGLPHELRAGGLPPSAVDVASFDGITVMGGSPRHRGIMAIIQGKWRIWPSVRSSGRIVYSEISGGPTNAKQESFHPADEVLLTRSGDDFRALVEAGKSIVSVMGEGAYAVRLDFDVNRDMFTLKHRAIGISGVGTPFPGTVIAANDKAVWVTVSGLYVYDGTEGTPLPIPSFEEWVAEVVASGDYLVAGYNERHKSIRIKRMRKVEHVNPGPQGVRFDGGDVHQHDGQSVVPGTIRNIIPVDRNVRVNQPLLEDVYAVVKCPLVHPDNLPSALLSPDAEQESFLPSFSGVVEEVVVSLKTGRLAKEYPTPGSFLVSSPWVANPDNQSLERAEAERQYSIAGNGDVFEIEPINPGVPYVDRDTYGSVGDYDIQSLHPVTGDATYLSTGWTGAHYVDRLVLNDATLRFDPGMVGDFVYFFRDEKIHGQELPVAICRITSAGDSNLGFSGTWLSPGAEFVIGRGPMEMRWAPYVGLNYGTVKTIERLSLATVASPRHTSDKNLTIKTFVNYADDPRDTQADVAVGATEPTRTTHSRAEAQGNAIELAIEVRDPSSEPRFSSIEITLREDGDSLAIAAPSG